MRTIREMLGLSDNSVIIELFESIVIGDIQKALDELNCKQIEEQNH